jgi:hypothetical protein
MKISDKVFKFQAGGKWLHQHLLQLPLLHLLKVEKILLYN